MLYIKIIVTTQLLLPAESYYIKTIERSNILCHIGLLKMDISKIGSRITNIKLT